MLVDYNQLDVQGAIEAGPIHPRVSILRIAQLLAIVGATVFICAAVWGDTKHAWGVFYLNTVYWMGLSVGAVITAVITQIVRARWCPPVRRLAEANIAYLPWAWSILMFTFVGKEYLFPWAIEPMPGREWWMQPIFVYIRFGLLFFLLFWLLARFVGWSLRADLGFAREKTSRDHGHWAGAWIYAYRTRGWQGSENEVLPLQRKMSRLGPVIIVVYALIYTFFATEMLCGMDKVWFSTMFGGFQFIGNIQLGWGVTLLLALYHAKYYPAYAKNLSTRQTWDLGMLMLGFGILWTYTMFAQFLPQWYANMPEETQWMILRTREAPWKHISWLTFTCTFILPFCLLLSEDIKKNPKTISLVALLALAGIWLEKYVIIMPQLFPTSVPFGWLEVIITLGFAGLYVSAIMGFLKKYPYLPVSHPLSYDSVRW